MTNDLSLILFDEIIAEFKKRFDAFIFASVNNTDSKTEHIITEYHGGKATGLGLAKFLIEDIIRDFKIQIKPTE